ncbi:MAG: Alpha amylase, catalytic region [Cyanobacteria bacterium RYN_339]|nr:Alpha amylase, catalytic region [Cyanobacteria bacterium RYN_339]
MRIALLMTTLLVLAGCARLPLGATPAPAAAPAAEARGGLPTGSIIYGAAPPMFGEQPLQSLTARLDDIKDLGTDALWLAPICATDDMGAISYATTDYKALRPDYGSMADLKALVAGAHKRGIKVLLDFVPNHTSVGHPFYKDAAAKGPSSPYWNYYMRDGAGKPQHYFDWSNLINLNYGNPAVQALMTDACSFWLKEAKVDGFRMDAAWGVKERTPTYWPQLRKALAAVKPGVFLLAEAGARDPYYVANGFDAAYDWTEELGHAAWEKVFDQPATAGDALRKAMAGSKQAPDRVARFLANNDTGDRFITRHGAAVQRVAATLLLTMPGFPIIYNGDEVGAEFSPYADPPPINWDDPQHLRGVYRQLGGLRHQVPSLAHGAFTEIAVKGAPGVYAFTRDAGNGDVALVVLNFGGAATAELPLPKALLPFATGGKLVDTLGAPNPPDAVDGVMKISLPATRALVLVPFTDKAPLPR